MAAMIAAARRGQQRELGQDFQPMSSETARSPSAWTRAWARLTAFRPRDKVGAGGVALDRVRTVPSTPPDKAALHHSWTKRQNPASASSRGPVGACTASSDIRGARPSCISRTKRWSSARRLFPWRPEWQLSAWSRKPG